MSQTFSITCFLVKEFLKKIYHCLHKHIKLFWTYDNNKSILSTKLVKMISDGSRDTED